MTAQPPEVLTGISLEDYRRHAPDAAVSAAVAAVRSYCDWHIAPSHSETRQVHGSGELLLLPTLRLTALTTVMSMDGTALSLDGVTWSRHGVVRGAFGADAYEVTFTHGHAGWPKEVERVILALADRGAVGPAKSQNAGPFSVGYDAPADDFSASERAVLDRYRLRARP